MTDGTKNEAGDEAKAATDEAKAATDEAKAATDEADAALSGDAGTRWEDAVREDGGAAEDDAAVSEPDPLALLETLTAERDELRERLMRSLADAENIRKRAERDVKDAQAYAGTKLARDVLGVYDNLGRALEAVGDEVREAAGGLVDGVDLTRRELLAAFQKHKIEPVDPAPGERFDPKLHQAMFEAPTPDAEPGTVVQVMQQGFTISGRLLRPAMVGIAAAAPAAPEPSVADPASQEAETDSA